MSRVTGLACCLVIFALGSTAVAVAQTSTAGGESPKTGWSYDGGLRYRTESGKFDLWVENRVQIRLTAEDPDLGDSSETFEIPRAKVRLQANYSDLIDGVIQIDLARGSRSGGFLLEDAFVLYKKVRHAQLWLGQGKVFFGRQQLTSSGDLMFVERSIAAEFFANNPVEGDNAPDNRDVGIALVGENRKQTYGYQFGVYNGNGINQDAKDNTDHLAVGRFVFTPFGEYRPSEVDLDRSSEAKLAVGISAQAATQGTEAINERLRDITVDLEVAFTVGGFNVLAEFFAASEDTLPLPGDLDPDDIRTDGWYLQLGYLLKSRWQLAGRASQIVRDISDSDAIEYALGVNYYLKSIPAKIQIDGRVVDFEGVEVTPNIDFKSLRAQFQVTF